jgi:hypothetical protein
MPDDPLQTSALNALAPFLALAPSATSPRAAADLIGQAIAAPGTYVFAELLSTPNIHALSSAEAPFQRWYAALEIFCWGTWGEYQGGQTQLMQLENRGTDVLQPSSKRGPILYPRSPTPKPTNSASSRSYRSAIRPHLLATRPSRNLSACRARLSSNPCSSKPSRHRSSPAGSTPRHHD